MELLSKKENTTKTIVLTGRLDTTTAPQLEAEVNAVEEDVTMLVMDFSGLEYISSAGLRVLLAAQKLMKGKKGDLVIKGVCDDIMEVFDITGFCDILTIEK